MSGLPNINMGKVDWKVLENINWDSTLENINKSNELYPNSENPNTFYLVYKNIKEFCEELVQMHLIIKVRVVVK